MPLPSGFNPPHVKGLDSRQESSHMFRTFTVADFAARGNILPVQLPEGAKIIGGSLTVIEASDDTGTATIRIGDAASPARYLALTNAKATGQTLIAENARIAPTREDVLIEYVPENGDAEAGIVAVRLEYVRLGRTSHTEG